MRCVQALAEEERSQRAAERQLAADERKRPYNSMYEVQAPSDHQMEAYLMKRKREEDPMSQFL